MKHYVYKLEDKNTGEFYYGSRTCKCKIEEDNYMGSMTTWKPNKENLVKTIIKEDFKSRNSATKYEKNIIKKFINHELNRNFAIPGEHSYKIGYVTVKDETGEYHWIHNEDERYLSGELVGVAKGMPTPDERKERISKTIKTNMSNLTDKEKKDKYGQPGKSNPMFGVKRTEEWKLEQANRMVQYYKEHEPPRKGATHSKESKKKMSEFRKEYYKTTPAYNLGKKWSEDIKKSISEGCRNQKKHTCKVCGKLATAGNITRWHNDNCKKITKN